MTTIADRDIDRPVNDAHDEPDTGQPPCDFCRRTIPCECDSKTCMCTCGRCCAPFWIDGIGWVPMGEGKSSR